MNLRMIVAEIVESQLSILEASYNLSYLQPFSRRLSVSASLI